MIHGAGSFGHIMALKYGLEKPGSIKGKEEAISKVVSDVLILNSVIIEYLNERGINAISVVILIDIDVAEEIASSAFHARRNYGHDNPHPLKVSIYLLGM